MNLLAEGVDGNQSLEQWNAALQSQPTLIQAVMKREREVLSRLALSLIALDTLLFQ